MASGVSPTDECRDSRFDDPAGWINYDTALCARNRYLLEDGLIWAETLFPLHHTAPEKALEQLASKWDWWTRGRITDFTQKAHGTVRQCLNPVWYYWVSVVLDARPIVALPGSDGWRVPMMMSGHSRVLSRMMFWWIPACPRGACCVAGFTGSRARFPSCPMAWSPVRTCERRRARCIRPSFAARASAACVAGSREAGRHGRSGITRFSAWDGHATRICFASCCRNRFRSSTKRGSSATLRFSPGSAA